MTKSTGNVTEKLATWYSEKCKRHKRRKQEFGITKEQEEITRHIIQ